MTLQQLQYVIALDTHRHFVRAAESCHVAQPTLTLQLKKLEHQLSTVLFDRSSKPLRPTPMGEIFIEKARQILRDVDQLKALVNEERTQIEGTFRLGIIPTIAPYLLPRFLGGFQDQYPDTRLSIQEIRSEEIIRQLEINQLDIGIMATPLQEQHIREIPLYYEPFLLYAHSENPILTRKKITPRALRPEELWLLNQGHCFRDHALNFCGVQENRLPTLEAGSIQTLKSLVRQLSGYTLIPELSYDKARDAKNCVKFHDPQPVREISLVVHKNFTKELLLTELRRTILDQIPENFRKNERFMTVKWR